MTIIDYAVIGGGVAGTYCAWRLKEKYHDKEVVLYERSNRIGGRLLSIAMSNSKQITELGGMRYLPSHKLFSHLVKTLNLSTKPFPMGSKKDPYGDENTGYFRGKRIKIKDLKDPTKNPYHLSSFDSGMSADDIQRQIVSMFVPQWESFTSPDDWFKVKIFEQDLWKWGFWNLLYRVLSPEEYSFLKYSSGYDTNVSNGNAVVLLPTGQDYSPGSENQYLTLENGMDSLPITLAKEFVEKFKGIEKLNHQLKSIKRNEEGSCYDLEFIQTRTTNGITTHSKDSEHIQVQAKHVILAMPRSALQSIDWDHFKTDEQLKDNLNSVIKQGAIKIILEYSHAWWLSLGLVYGRSLTDLPLRQTMYFTSEDDANRYESKIENAKVKNTELNRAEIKSKESAILMASYNDIETVPFWKGFIKDSELFPGISVFNAPKSMVFEAHKQVAEMHGKRALPEPIAAAYYDWTQEPYGAAWHCWKANYNYKDIIDKMIRPIDKENVYICGEAYSNDQGWAEGALETAESVLFKLEVETIIDEADCTENVDIPDVATGEVTRSSKHATRKIRKYLPNRLRRMKY